MNTKYTLQCWNSGRLLGSASPKEISEGLEQTIFTIDKNTSYSDVFLVDGKEVCLYIEKHPSSEFVIEYHYADGDIGAYLLSDLGQEQLDLCGHIKDALVKGPFPGSEYAGLEQIVIRLADENGN
jgi:hypothetical protein